MTSDPFAEFKARQREGWKLFAPLAMNTTPPAARLVGFARVRSDQKLLDVGCGNGVVAITARRARRRAASAVSTDFLGMLLPMGIEGSPLRRMPGGRRGENAYPFGGRASAAMARFSRTRSAFFSAICTKRSRFAILPSNPLEIS